MAARGNKGDLGNITNREKRFYVGESMRRGGFLLVLTEIEDGSLLK